MDGDTLFPVFSAAKAVAATIVHRRVERGLVDYETPVAEVWPEFAAQGKHEITVRHALSHMAGLQHMPMGIGYRDVCSWGTMCEAMANARPVSRQGAQQAYHAITFSWVVGEIACRVGGHPFGQLLLEEICRPLGMTDLFTGIPDAVAPRVAVLEEIFEPGKEPQVDDTKPQSIPGWIQPLHIMMNRADARRACIPASNGIMSARALARHYAALLPGGVDGVELLPPSRVQQATQIHKPSEYSPEGDWMRMSLGYFVGGEGSDMGPRNSAFGHGGSGGSVGFADPEIRLGVALTKNLFSAKGAGGRVLAELRAAVP